MSVQVTSPEDLSKRIDDGPSDELARINELADELNREAEDALEYQVIP